MGFLHPDIGELIAGLQFTHPGSLSRPSLAWERDPDTGITHRGAQGEFSFISNGVEVGRITADGFLFPLFSSGSVLFVGTGGTLDEDTGFTYNATTDVATLVGGLVVPAVGPVSTQQHTLPAVASDTVALLAATQTLTGKTLTGNIAVTLLSGAAVITLPTSTSALATLALAETLTSKTLTGLVAATGGSGGVIITGGTDADDDLTLRATASATDGDVIIETDPTTERGRFFSTGHVLIGGGTFSNVAGFARLLQIQATSSAMFSFREPNVTAQQYDFGIADPAGTSSKDFSVYDTTAGVWRLMLRMTTGTLSINSTDALGQLLVDQSNTTAAIPVISLEQRDIDQDWFELDTTIGTGNATEAVGAKVLTTTHFLKVTITGVGTRYIPCGTIA